MLQAHRLVTRSAIGLSFFAAASAASAAPTEKPAAEASLAATRDPAASAEEPGAVSRSEPSRFQLGLGTGLTWGLGDVWEVSGDLSGNAGPPILLDLSVAPSYRLSHDFALGVRAGVGIEPGSRAEVSSSGGSVSLDRKQWHVSALGRYQPQPGRGWYASLSAGAAAMVDSRGDASVSQWAPLLGTALGYELSIARPLSLGFELRAAYAPFGEGSRSSPAGYYDYQVSTWVGAGVVGNIMP